MVATWCVIKLLRSSCSRSWITQIDPIQSYGHDVWGRAVAPIKGYLESSCDGCSSRCIDVPSRIREGATGRRTALYIGTVPHLLTIQK